MMLKYLPDYKIIDSDTESDSEEDELQKLPKELFQITELDLAKGLEYCGDAQDYLAALEIYAASVEKKASEIVSAQTEGNLDSYVTLVHSLKSTSRAVGAEDIAGLALALEQAGKNGDMDMIYKRTPELLERYKNLKV